MVYFLLLVSFSFLFLPFLFQKRSEGLEELRASLPSKHGAGPVALRPNNRQVQRGRYFETISSIVGFSRAKEVEMGEPASAPVRRTSGAQPGVPLTEAVKSAQVSEIKTTLDDARDTGHLTKMLDERNLRRQPPLHLAADAGRFEVAQLLLDYDAPVNVVDARGETALHIAGASGHTQVVLLLLRRGAGVLVDKHGKTALHRAAHRGHADAVKVMLDHHEPWFAAFAESFECGEAEGGSTPLHAATVAGHASVVGAIMESFRHAPETLEKLKRAKDRWGIVPEDILEGQAPPMLTACVRETLKERKEAQSELKKQLEYKGDTSGGIRWCENPSAIPMLPISVQRKLEKDARERSQRQFKHLQSEMNRSRDSGKHEEQECETPRTIRKTIHNFVLLESGEVDLECIYQRCSFSKEGADAGGCSWEGVGSRMDADAAGDGNFGHEVFAEGGTEEDFIDGDCEFEFNFDMMGVDWGSDSDCSDES